MNNIQIYITIVFALGIIFGFFFRSIFDFCVNKIKRYRSYRIDGIL